MRYNTWTQTSQTYRAYREASARCARLFAPASITTGTVTRETVTETRGRRGHIIKH
ncbi:hypothetical protein [Natronoglycomyces albus]|uniref:Uncharacterized protein n=1 Tax=Natronoglycomyces albus TaxID=2811108 RepID=A0A895XUT6_9ACTN|nr:hypothetical protein [Natronoglycomyces albus]QSB07145.1 hypothetical protein JQS30_17025 [Natronoglycomyces albus]